MPWTVDVLELDATPLHTGVGFRSGRVTWSLDGPGAVELDLADDQLVADRWLFGQRRVLVRDSEGSAVFQGWLERFERGGKPGALEYRASGRGLAAALDQAVVHGDFKKVEVVANDIAWDLIEHAQNQSGNHWGFTEGTHMGGTHPSRDRYFCDGDVIGERIRELAEMSDGFSWEIDPSGAFNTWRLVRGTDLTDSFSFSDEDTTDFQITCDAAELATVVTGLGDRDDNQPCGPPLVIDTDSGAVALYGRREVVIESEANNEFDMNEKTTAELEARLAARVEIRAGWIEGRGPWAFGDVWLGDVVKVTGIPAELGGDVSGEMDARLTGVTVSLQGLHEFVEMDFEAA